LNRSRLRAAFLLGIAQTGSLRTAEPWSSLIPDSPRAQGMTQNNRLKTILEKQDATDRAHVAELARQAVAASQAKEAQTRVANEWRRVYSVLQKTIETANGAMTGRRKLYSQPYNPHAERTVGDLIIMFEDKYSEEVERKCIVGADSDGTVLVSIVPQKKEYRLSIWSATIDQIEGIVYDFMELNVETPLKPTRNGRRQCGG
jgi:hypothetical protein